MSEAYAFSSIMLGDPDFREFAFIDIPVVFSFLAAFVETLLFREIAQETGRMNFYLRMVIANVYAMVVNILVMAVIMIISSGTIQAADSRFVEIIAAICLGVIFIYSAWDQKCRALKKIEKGKYSTSGNSKKLILETAISYGFLYTFLYFSLF